MTRNRLSLDGAWDFQFDPEASLSPERMTAWRAADVPMPWQAAFEDLRGVTGTAWYCRTFDVPADWAGHAVILHFGAVAYYAEIWLNGNRVGEHEGSYLPFEFEVSSGLAMDAPNQLLVRAVAPSDDPQRYPAFRFSEIPHGKQSWYGPIGGIWQSVWLERRDHVHVRAVRLYPDLNTGVVQVLAELASGAPDGCLVELRIAAPDGEVLLTHVVPVSAGDDLVCASLQVTQPQPWSPDHPHLYSVQIMLACGGERFDMVTESFGFRTIDRRQGRLYLNGEPLYLRGALDQDYYADTICTPPSTAFLEDQFRRAKALGLNCVRCHMKVGDPRYLEAADRVGMLVWADLPNTGRFTDASAQRLRETLHGMLDRDRNHPSIIIWTIINENWGTDLVFDEEHRAWLKETYSWLAKADPTRLIIDNSACWPNYHLQTDVNDFHIYRAMPDHRTQWDETITEFVRDPDWAFCPEDKTVSGDEPRIVSEFGNWGLSDTDCYLDKTGEEPWWFETGGDWGDGAGYIHGVKDRFRIWHLDQVFDSWPAFVEATQWQQFEALKYEIESMRRQPAIAGYVITELTDVHWEANGLLDMRRRPKVFADKLAAVNADTVVIPVIDRTAYWSAEPVWLDVYVAHGAGPVLEGARVEWALTGSDRAGRVTVPPMQAGQVKHLERIGLHLPEVQSSERRRLNLVLRSGGGAVIAENHITIDILPGRGAEPHQGLALSTSDSSLWEYLSALGYRMTADRQAAALVVARALDAQLTSYVRRGGRLLLLADSRGGIEPCLPGLHVIEPCFPFARLEARQDTLWQGDWISTFTWLRRHGPFARLPGGPLLERGFERVIPEFVLAGLRPQDFEARVHAGLVVGWVHKPAAVIAERPYGRGQAVISTFRLTTDPPGADPIATLLMDALIESSLRADHHG